MVQPEYFHPEKGKQKYFWAEKDDKELRKDLNASHCSHKLNLQGKNFIELKKRTVWQIVTLGFQKAYGQLLYQTESSDFTNKNAIMTKNTTPRCVPSIWFVFF